MVLVVSQLYPGMVSTVFRQHRMAIKPLGAGSVLNMYPGIITLQVCQYQLCPDGSSTSALYTRNLLGAEEA